MEDKEDPLMIRVNVTELICSGTQISKLVRTCDGLDIHALVNIAFSACTRLRHGISKDSGVDLKDTIEFYKHEGDGRPKNDHFIKCIELVVEMAEKFKKL